LIIEIEETKNFAKIEYEEDDNLLTVLISVAEESLKNATGIEFTSENNLAKLYCFVIVKDLYDNREMTTDKTSEKIKNTIQSILIQLKYCYPVVAVIV